MTNLSVFLYLNVWGLDTLILCLVGVLHLLDAQRQHVIMLCLIMSYLLTSRQKNKCLIIVWIIVELLLLYTIEWFLFFLFFCTSFVEKNYLTQPRKCIDIRKHSSTWLRSRSAVGEISARRGNILLIWIIFFCWWKLPLWWDLVEIIFPPRWDKFSHMNSPLIWDLICAILISTMFLTF